MLVSQIKPNPNNPRLIKDDKFKKLVQSIKDFLEEWGLEVPEFKVEEAEAVEDDFDVPEGGIKTDIVLGDLFEIGRQVERVVQYQRSAVVHPAHEATADCGHVDERERIQQDFTRLDARAAQMREADGIPMIVGARHAFGRALGA